jgi:hypothetical protein
VEEISIYPKNEEEIRVFYWLALKNEEEVRERPRAIMSLGDVISVILMKSGVGVHRPSVLPLKFSRIFKNYSEPHA